MRFLRKILVGERGQVLPMALILLVLGGLLVVPTLGLVSTSLIANREVDTKTLAYYAADAGIEDAYWQLSQQTVTPTVPSGVGTWYTLPSSLNDSLNGMTVTLANAKAPVVQGNMTTYTLSSTATKGGNTEYTTVVGIQRTQTTGGGGGGAYVFDHAVSASGGSVYYDVLANGNVTITSSGSGGTDQGDIYATGNILFNGHGSISGTATATGTITGISADQSNMYADAITYNPIDLSVYKLAEGVGTIHSGDWTINSGSATVQGVNGLHIIGSLTINTSGTVTLNGPIHIHSNFTVNSNTSIILNGDVYVEGAITFNGKPSITGTGNLIAKGAVTFNGSTTLDPSSMPLIASATGNIVVNGNGDITGNFYAPNGTITINGTATVTGALFAKSIVLNGSATVNYPTDVDYSQLGGGGGGGGAVITVQLNSYAR